MRNIVGIICLVLGFITIAFGGIGLFIYYLHDLVINFETLTRDEVFWNILWLFFREIIPLVVGLSLLGIGYVINKD
jgi:hypothetical protein